MRLPIRDAPPTVDVRASYRELFQHGAFAQRELVPDNQLASMARERGIAQWIGQEAPEAIDQRGALCPIAFAHGAYMTGFTVPAEEPGALSFREEEPAKSWSEYGWDAWGHPQVSPLYSAWQLLYLDVVTREASVELPVDLTLASGPELQERLEPTRRVIEAQRSLFAEIDTAWRPLIKVLVVAQNVYWPRVSGRVAVVPVGPGEGFADAGNTGESAEGLLQCAGCSVEELTAAYYFLVERGLNREPQDGLVVLRRSVPREYHVRWRGRVRHAQDHFDAAQVLYLWLRDLLGSPPGRPDTWPLDGRQADRMALYDNSPASVFIGERLKRELIETELYPHGPLVVGEGASERIIIDWLLQALLGLHGAFRFYDLEGSGAASRIPQLLESFEDYAADAFVIVDNEGEMGRYMAKAISDGKIDQENVLLAAESLEHDNFSPGELIDVARELAENPPDGRGSASLGLTAEQLLEEHAYRRDRIPHNKPGIADTLLVMIQRSEHGHVRLNKSELAEGLAKRLVDEVQRAEGSEGFDAVKARRPIVGFVADRICPVLNRPRPIS